MPVPKKPAFHAVCVKLPAALVAQLDQYRFARSPNPTRTHVVKRALEAFLRKADAAARRKEGA